MPNTPFKIPSAPNRTVTGQYRSPSAPTPMATFQEAQRAGTDVNTIGDLRRRQGLFPDHATPNGAPSGQVLPWPGATTPNPSPMKLRP